MMMVKLLVAWPVEFAAVIINVESAAGRIRAGDCAGLRSSV